MKNIDDSIRKKIKMLHKENISYYDSDMKEQLIEEKDIAMILLQSLENNEFVVYYQPKVDSRTQTIVAAQALISRNHEELGFVSPGEFIPIAENTGMIIDIGKFVIEESFKKCKELYSMSSAKFTMAINKIGSAHF